MGWRGTPNATLARGGNQATGYYTGMANGPYSGGQGSGLGQAVSGAGALAQGNSVNIGGQAWHPTILYLGALVLVEMVVFGWLGKVLG